MNFLFLLFPAVAQSVIYGAYVEGRIPRGLILVGCLLPFYVPTTLHFCRVPLFSFERHHRIWLIGMIWFGMLAVGAELLLAFGTPKSVVHAPVVLRVVMHLGWYGFVQLARSHRDWGSEWRRLTMQ